jgi:hypothetical protein
MTHGAAAALATSATLMQTPRAHLGGEVTVAVLDRPSVLRRLPRERDGEQVVVKVAAAIAPHPSARALDARAGSHVTNHDATHVDARIERLREAAAAAFGRAGYDVQRAVVAHRSSTRVSSYGFLQAARREVPGDEHVHGDTLRFETTWLDTG